MKNKKPLLVLGLTAIAAFALTSCSIFDIIDISVDSESSEKQSSRPASDIPTLDEADFDAVIHIDTSAETSQISLSNASQYITTSGGFSITTIDTESLHASGDGGFYFGTTSVGGAITFHFDAHYITGVSLVLGSGSTRVSRTVSVSTDSHAAEAATATISPSIVSLTDFDGDNKNSTSLTLSANKSFYVYEIGLTFGEITPIYPTSIALPSTAKVTVGKTSKLSYTYAPNTANTFNTQWSTSNSSVASVDQQGNVTGESEGTATITLTVTNPTNTLSATTTITVVEGASVEPTSMAFDYGDLQANSFYSNMDACPTHGQPKLLIIPVWFTDSDTYIKAANKDNVRSDIAAAYLGSSSDTGWESVASFYEKESAGRVQLTGTVSDWYECNKASTYYYQESDDEDEAGKVPTLVDSAVDWYFKNHKSESRKDYDTDGNGYLDGVMLIYGAPDYGSMPVGDPYEPDNDNMWAYCFWTGENSNKTTPNPNVFFWASYDFMYDSSTARSRTGKSNYGGGNCSHCVIDSHTFTHEMGHVFGADDYYDYSSQYCPAGGFSMQDMNVGGHDPYTAMAYGWADPFIPTESCQIDLHPFQSTKELILLTPSWNAYDSPFDEYLLLELYTPTGLNKFDSDYVYQNGYPQGPKQAGIRLWHVDARLAHYIGNDRFDSNLTSNVALDSVGHAMSNTYYKSPDSTYSNNYISILGKSYADYNILQLIRDSSNATYKPGYSDYLTANYLFVNNESFSMSKYAGQFKNSGKLNSNQNLGWSFSVSISGTGEGAVATIDLVKA